MAFTDGTGGFQDPFAAPGAVGSGVGGHGHGQHGHGGPPTGASDPFASVPTAAAGVAHRRGSGPDTSGVGVGGGGGVSAGGAQWFNDGGASSGGGGVDTSMGAGMGGGIGSLGGGMGVDASASGAPRDQIDYDNEPPLLEELGINWQHILNKTMAVLNPTKEVGKEVMEDADFAGPLVFCLGLGFAMLLLGKVHFGYIYGVGACGCIAMWLVLNLMAADDGGVDVYQVFSIHGYCLLPICLLALVNVVIDLNSWFGAVLSLGVICWCTYPCTRFFEKVMRMTDHRWLIAYPVFMLYACFALITIF